MIGARFALYVDGVLVDDATVEPGDDVGPTATRQAELAAAADDWLIVVSLVKDDDELVVFRARTPIELMFGHRSARPDDQRGRDRTRAVELGVRVGELFAGIGGFGLGFERAGFEVAWQVEVDERCRSVLAERFAGVERYADVRALDYRRVAAVDVLAGGWPCQPVSVAGRRRGMADERDLWPEFARAVAALRPRWVVGENVPGALTGCGCAECDAAGRVLDSHRGRYWRRVVDDLCELGYGVAWATLDAQYWRLAQRRDRVFVVARLGDVAGPVEVLLDGAPSGRDAPPFDSSPETVARTLGARASESGGVRDDYETSGAYVVVNALHASDGGADEDDAEGGRLVVESFRKTTKAHDGADDPERWEPASIAPTVDAAGHGPRTATAVVAYSITPERGQGADLVATEVETSPALSTISGSNRTDRGTYPVDLVGVRQLTPRECERLQGFDDDWTLVGSMRDSPRYRMIGNAVPPPIVEWIARRIVVADR